MANARVSKLNVKQKVNPIVREHDNTTDLENAEMRAHGKYKGLRAPDSIIPDIKTTAPPHKTSTIPG